MFFKRSQILFKIYEIPAKKIVELVNFHKISDNLKQNDFSLKRTRLTLFNDPKFLILNKRINLKVFKQTDFTQLFLSFKFFCNYFN